MAELIEIDMDLIDDPEVDIREWITREGIEELAKSIRNVGLIQPIVVFKNRDRYEVLVGHRRYLACKSIELGRIPAIVREVRPDEIDVMKLDENIFREDVSPIQIATYIRKIQLQKELTTMEIARYLGKTPQWVNSMLRLIDIDEYAKDAVDQGEISYSSALELQKVEDPRQRRVLTEAAIKGGAHTRVVKGWVQEYRTQAGPSPEPMETGYEEPEEQKERVYKMKCALCDRQYPAGELITIQIDPKCYPIFREMAKNVREQLADQEI